MLRTPLPQRGITLIELMIAGVIALVALSAVLTVYSATARHSLLQLETAHLNQQLHAMLALIGRDLRRAGFRAFDPGVDDSWSNPFQRTENRLRVAQHAGETAGSCVLFAYDLDKDGKVGVGTCDRKGCAAGTDASNVEQFGFRLKNRRLQSRYAGSSLDCDSGHWQSINDPGIDVTMLVFTLHTRCANLLDATAACNGRTPALEHRSLSVEIAAQIHNKPDTRLTLGQWVKIRNNRLATGSAQP